MNPTNPLTNGVEDDQVLQTEPYTNTVYVPFVVPDGEQWTVGGLFVNLLSYTNVVDPLRATYSISTGVSKGDAGTTIAIGTAPVSYAPTGRSYESYTEYTLLANIHTTVLQPGTYWLSLMARCTNPKDTACHLADYYISDVEDNPPLNVWGLMNRQTIRSLAAALAKSFLCRRGEFMVNATALGATVFRRA
jgi:hypothetical protein